MADAEEEVVTKTETTEQTDQSNVRDYDKEAREQWGWVSKEEFKGDPERWKPARQFVEDGERIQPILQANNKRLREDLAKERSEHAARLAKLERITETVYKRGLDDRDREIARLKSAQESAVEAGDKAEFRKLDAQIEELRKPEPEAEIRQDEPPELSTFKSTNSWYGVDPALTAYANEYSKSVSTPTQSLGDNMRAVEAHMRQMFPAKYPTAAAPKANGHAAVDGGGVFGNPGRSDKKVFSDLPADVKATYEKFDPRIKAALSKEQYAKEYLNG